MLRRLTAILCLLAAVLFVLTRGTVIPKGNYVSKYYIDEPGCHYEGYADVALSIFDSSVSLHIEEHYSVKDKCAVKTNMTLTGSITQNRNQATVNFNQGYYTIDNNECFITEKVERKVAPDQYINSYINGTWQVSPMIKNKDNYCFKIKNDRVLCFTKEA